MGKGRQVLFVFLKLEVRDNRPKTPLVSRAQISRKCGRLVCKYCSRNKRRLSVKDTKFYRICDYCETRLANKLF